MRSSRPGRRQAPILAVVALATGLLGSSGAARAALARHADLADRAPSAATVPEAGACVPGPVPPRPLPTTTTTTTYPGEPTTTTTYPGQPTTTTNKFPAAYYLFESDGAVVAYGGADDFGSTASTHLPAVVAAAVTPDGGGYWMATVAGDVYHFGDARFYGSPVHGLGKGRIVSMAATSDGQGYWLVTASGNVYNYGDAPFCGSRAVAPPSSPVVAFAPTPDGQGYWLVTASGLVLNFGDAGHFGSDGRPAPRTPVVAFAPTPNGKGYWLVTANGGVYNYGDATFYGSAVHLHFPKTVTDIAVTADGGGYWLVTATGRVFHFGDAHYAGSLLHSPPPASVTVPAIVRSSPGVLAPARSTFPPGELGYDLSNFQCAKGSSTSIQANVPRRSGIAILQVVGWLDSSFNSCLASEAAWAQQAAGGSTAGTSLYLFVNSPGETPAASVLEQDGPAGICSARSGEPQLQCDAYNYGYNGAENAINYANSRGVAAKVWWLDVENANLSRNSYSNLPVSYWSDSKKLNAATIQGALDALHKAGIIAGIYSTSLQFATIAGRYVPPGPAIPLWVAGVPWTRPPYSETGLYRLSILASWCAGTAVYPGTKTTDVFAGGIPWLLQETPGPEASPYGLDPDYSC